VLIAITAFIGEVPEGKAHEAGFEHYPAKPADRSSSRPSYTEAAVAPAGTPARHEGG
jgi:hypothetical protein